MGFRKFNVHVRKNHLEKYVGKSNDLFYIEIFFLLQNDINTLYNLYCDYWDLITEFWPGSSK